MFSQLFNLDGLAPHGSCLLWERNLLWTYASSDSLIAIAYFSISATIILFLIRREDWSFRWTAALFSSFILACAASHGLEVWTLWYPDYDIQAVVKMLTAAISLSTAISLWPMLPRALAMPSIAQLAAANRALNAEIAERRQIEHSLRDAEESLRRTQEELERRVEERTQELAHRTRELEQINRELEQFAYVASHDLRQPLRMVSSFLSLLERRLPAKLDAECQDYLNFARDGAQRMDRLIVDLLDYARVGRDSMASAEVSLEKVLETACRTVEESLSQAGGRIFIDRPMPVVWGNEGELLRLFDNLIGNAIKYRDQGRALEIAIDAETRADHWLVKVADNGIGIAPEYQQRIFGVFQRLHGGDRFEGTGIGLAVCRKIVESRGGRIWVESEPGEGSVFFFTLPFAPVLHSS